MTDLDAFLQGDIEGYLLGDLKQMQGTSVGFPLLLAAFSGAEVFGALLSSSHFNAGSGEDYFVTFWDGYLYPTSAAPRDTASVVYNLARHGLAHAYVLKGPLAVTRGRENAHLTKDAGGDLILDAGQFASDLMDSYVNRVLPIAKRSTGSPSAQTMGERLKEIRKIFGRQARALAPVVSQFPSSTIDSAPISRSFR